MFEHTLLCLQTVLCILSNWQKKNWKLNFQSDNVIVLKENLVFNMRYHVKIICIRNKVHCWKLNVTKCIMLQGAGMIRKTFQKPDTVWYVPHFMHILTLCCSFKIVLVKMYKISEFYNFLYLFFLAGKQLSFFNLM